MLNTNPTTAATDDSSSLPGISLRNWWLRIEVAKIRGFLTKIVIALLFVTFGNPVSLSIIGLINRICFRFIDSAFVCYAANDNYRNKYWFKFALPLISSFPAIVGCYFQGGKMGLIFVISSTEDDFRKDKSLVRLMRNVYIVRKCLGVKSFHYSGILPTELGKRSLVSADYLSERSEMVAKVVLAAEKQVRELENVTGYIPVIILGGRGNVGSKIGEGLKELGRQFYIVDQGDLIPEELKNTRCVLVDVARKGAVQSYVNQFWSGMIFLNETYPEPEKDLLSKLEKIGIPSYHVSGVTARAYPKFPKSYAGGVPCCALITDNDVKALVKRL